MKTLKSHYTHKIEIDHSIFICTLFTCVDEDEAMTAIGTISKQYQDATHNCWCFLTNEAMRASDDGEPTGTAGLPMLEVLKKNKLMNVGAVVTRYFGGVKLGAGGLIRAYSKSVSSALSQATIISIKPMHLYRISFDYLHLKQIELELNRLSIPIQNKFFNEQIDFYILLEHVEQFEQISYLPFIDHASLGLDYLEMGGEPDVSI